MAHGISPDMSNIPVFDFDSLESLIPEDEDNSLSQNTELDTISDDQIPDFGFDNLPGVDFGDPEPMPQEEKAEPVVNAPETAEIEDVPDFGFDNLPGVDFGDPEPMPQEEKAEPVVNAPETAEIEDVPDFGFDNLSGVDFGDPEPMPQEEKAEPVVNAPETAEIEDVPDFGFDNLSGIDFGESEPTPQEEKLESIENPFEGLEAENLQFPLSGSILSKGSKSSVEEEQVNYSKMDMSCFEVERKDDETSNDRVDSIWDAAPSIAKQTIHYDPEVINCNIPSDLSYCMITMPQQSQNKSMEWKEKCSSAFPKEPSEILTLIHKWFEQESRVYLAPKIVAASQIWTLDDILQNDFVKQEIIRCSASLWNEVIEQAEGMESVSCMQSYFVVKMLHHVINFYVTYAV